MFDDRTAVMGIPAAVIVSAAGAIMLVIGAVLVWRAIPSVSEPDSFRATVPRAGGSGLARTARLGLGLTLAIVAAEVAFAITPLSCTTGARLAGPYWLGEFLGQPQLVLVPALVFGAGGWVALDDPEPGWRVVGLGLSLMAALLVLVLAVTLAPACG